MPRAAPVPLVSETALPRAGEFCCSAPSATSGSKWRALTGAGEKITVVVPPSVDAAGLAALGVNVVQADALKVGDVKTAFATAPFRAALSILERHAGRRDARL